MSPEPETIEVEAVEVDRLPAPYAAAPPTLFHTADPVEVVERATRTAEALKSVVDARGLTVKIQGREHVKVEGWTLLGSMLGVFAVTVATEKTQDHKGADAYTATVEARRPNSSSPTGYDVVGAATTMCSRSESNWKGRDDHALLSMAQTRATSKALATALRFVMELAGYATTPAEEMPRSREPQEPPVAHLNRVLEELTVLEEREDWTAVAKEFCQTYFEKDSIAKLNKGELGSLIAELERRKTQLQAEGGPV